MRVVSIVVAALIIVAGVAGCARSPEPEGESGAGSSKPPTATPPPAPSPREPGLVELPDGRVQALGRLARVDLEGGFWAIVEGAGEQQGMRIVAVIANPDAWERELEALEGVVVIATGRRFEGMSIRMAGPEIVVESIATAGTVPGAPK
ncbi:MAG: hypothetical protein QMD76_00975 [Anaerosomatales bacterium]|nr:hypothetical protein [Coriobacteriia bacterium]MDI6691874.1 hypothetical protein [Anaerosomatales bacterium]